MFSITEIIATSLCWIFSIFGCILIFITFKKPSVASVITFIGLILGGLQETINNIKNGYSSETVSFKILAAFGAFCYFYLFYTVNLLYVYRINSLGLEKTSHIYPFITLLISIIIQVLYLIQVYTNLVDYTIYIWTCVALFAIAMVVEIFLTIKLVQKVLLMFEYRTHLKKLTIFKIKFYLGLIIFLELVIWVIRILYSGVNSPQGHLRILGFILRLIIVIDFYRDITIDITRNIELNNFYSAPEYGAKDLNFQEMITTI